jgi:GTP-binding protein LepA
MRAFCPLRSAQDSEGHRECQGQQFVLKIQAHALGRIVSSRSISAVRKDVTGYLYGGDITRKMKLLEKQKKGKKRRGVHAKMEIPQEVFMKMVQDSER